MSSALVAVGCRYRARWARSLQVWDLQLAPGAIGHLHAPNGAGKSTFLRAVAGLEPARWQRRHLGSDVRYVPTAAGPAPTLPVGAHARLVARRSGVDPRAREAALDRWGLRELAPRDGDALSAGERRAVALALALAPGRGRSVVLLDEPSVALDDGRRAVLVDQIVQLAEGGSVVVIAGHDAHLRAQVGGVVVTEVTR